MAGSGIHLEENAVSEAFDARVQGAEVLAEDGREHWVDFVDEVGGGTAFERLLIEVRALFDEVADVGDVDADLVNMLRLLFN